MTLQLRAKKFRQPHHYSITLSPPPIAHLPPPPRYPERSIIHPAVYRRLRSWFALATIGRKHKPHRQQAPAAKGKHGKDKNPNRGKAGRGWRMGQDESSIVDESIPPETLPTRDLAGVAKFVRDGRAKSVVVMVRLNTY